MDTYILSYGGADYTVYQDEVIRLQGLYETNQLAVPRLCGLTLIDATSVYIVLGPGIPLTIARTRH